MSDLVDVGCRKKSMVNMVAPTVVAEKTEPARTSLNPMTDQLCFFSWPDLLRGGPANVAT